MPLFDIATEHYVTLKLPYPPTINSYYGRTRTGKVFIGTKGREYRKLVIDILRSSLPHTNALTEKLSVWIEVHVPDKRIRDLDNINKALLDAISHARNVWTDDYNIDDLRVTRGPQIKGGYVRVHIRKILNEKATKSGER